MTGVGGGAEMVATVGGGFLGFARNGRRRYLLSFWRKAVIPNEAIAKGGIDAASEHKVMLA